MPQAHDDPALTPVPADILDQFAEVGPPTAQELHTAMRRLKKAQVARAPSAPSRLPNWARQPA